MPLGRRMAAFNLRVTNRVLGPLAPHLPGLGVIVHTGRRSGRQYRTPVNVFAVDGGYAVALTYGPGSQWVRNILAAGACDLETRGHTHHLTDPELVHDESRSLVPAFARVPLGAMRVNDFLRLTTAPG